MIKTYVQGQNLDEFAGDIRSYQVIITYNGKSFDIPFIESFFDILKLRETPFYQELLMPDSMAPANPYEADLKTVDRIKNNSRYWNGL